MIAAVADRRRAVALASGGCARLAVSRWQIVSGSAVAVALYVWDDVLLAAPILAVARLVGAPSAFCLFALVYGTGSFVLALLAVRAYDRWSAGTPSHLASWLASREGSARAQWVERVLHSGKAFGFIISSWALGAILTVWLLRYSGRTENLTVLAALSSLIFGLTFVGFYSGLFQLIQ